MGGGGVALNKVTSQYNLPLKLTVKNQLSDLLSSPQNLICAYMIHLWPQQNVERVLRCKLCGNVRDAQWLFFCISQIMKSKLWSNLMLLSY